MPAERSWGRIAYQAFTDKLGELATSTMPPWDLLSVEMRAAWDAGGFEVAFQATHDQAPTPGHDE